MKILLPQINFTEVPRPVSVTYTAALPVRDQTVLYLSSLLHASCAYDYCCIKQRSPCRQRRVGAGCRQGGFTR
jgi:hypothetical protein